MSGQLSEEKLIVALRASMHNRKYIKFGRKTEKMKKNRRDCQSTVFMEGLGDKSLDEYWKQKIRRTIKPIYRGTGLLLQYSKMSYDIF